MISQGSCDTEDWSNVCWRFSFAITEIYYNLKYIQKEQFFLNCNNIYCFWSNKCRSYCLQTCDSLIMFLLGHKTAISIIFIKSLRFFFSVNLSQNINTHCDFVPKIFTFGGLVQVMFYIIVTIWGGGTFSCYPFGNWINWKSKYFFVVSVCFWNNFKEVCYLS